MKQVKISVSGVAKTADIESLCRQAVAPFVNDRCVLVEIIFVKSDEVGVKIETIGITLLRHPLMIEPQLREDVARIRDRLSTEQAPRPPSNQFAYVVGDSEAAEAAVKP